MIGLSCFSLVLLSMSKRKQASKKTVWLSSLKQINQLCPLNYSRGLSYWGLKMPAHSKLSLKFTQHVSEAINCKCNFVVNTTTLPHYLSIYMYQYINIILYKRYVAAIQMQTSGPLAKSFKIKAKY